LRRLADAAVEREIIRLVPEVLRRSSVATSSR